MKKRDVGLDALRMLGIFTIMLAHAEPPAWLYQLRNFGTPLLIVASGLATAVTYRSREIETSTFYMKRLAKLIMPAWIFIPIFYGVFFLSFRLVGQPFPFNFETILDTFAFSGIEGVWILKVYIILALVTPWALRIDRRITDSRIYITFLILAYVTYEGIVWEITPRIPPRFHAMLVSNIFPAIPYSLLFIYGMRLDRMRKRSVLLAALLGGAVFSTMAYIKYVGSGGFVQTQEFKYPPTLYYLSYGFLFLNLFYLAKDTISARLPSRWVLWVSSNSLWIYLWHIMALYIWDFTLGPTHGDLLTSFARAIFLFSFGAGVTAIQIRIARAALAVVRHSGIAWIFGLLAPHQPEMTQYHSQGKELSR
jgi:peptidoglycan/LPS O-acetylase OafA/YrhL